jgi:hypothetical protein
VAGCADIWNAEISVNGNLKLGLGLVSLVCGLARERKVLVIGERKYATLVAFRGEIGQLVLIFTCSTLAAIRIVHEVATDDA